MAHALQLLKIVSSLMLPILNFYNYLYKYNSKEFIKNMHMIINSFSSFLVINVLTEETTTTTNKISHHICYFSMLDVPNQIETNIITDYYSQLLEMF